MAVWNLASEKNWLVYHTDYYSRHLYTCNLSGWNTKIFIDDPLTSVRFLSSTLILLSDINPEGHDWNGSVTSNHQHNSIREFCYHHFNCMDNIYMYVRSQLDSRCQLFNIATSESCIIRTSFISHLHTKLGILSRGVSGLSTDSPCGVWDEPIPSCVVIHIWAFLNDCV